MTRYPYRTGFCGNGDHEVCRLRWSGRCDCTCGHPAPAAARTVGPCIGSLCSGAGGLDLAVLQVLGGTVAWHAEYEPPTEKNPNPSQAGARVLAYRWPGVPNHGDITTTDWATVESVDIVTAGYPCQPDSAAGKRLGEADERWIWPAVRDAIRDLGPRLAVLENVAGHLGRGFPGVVGDLAEIGYDCRWCCVPASAVGAPHRRERLFVVAYPADSDGPRRGALLLGAAAAGWPERDDAGRGGLPSVAHSAGNRWHEGRAEPEGQFRRPDDALSGDAVADPAGDGLVRDPGSTGSGAACGGGERVAGRGDRGVPDADPGGEGLEVGLLEHHGPQRSAVERGGDELAARWGRWAPAIRRWEAVTRPAPDPVELGRRGNRRLNPAFSEWMMGLPAGWVTAVPGLSRNDQLRLIGNGVVPQQGVAALRWLLADLAVECAA